MSDTLQDLQGLSVYMDDIVVYGENMKEDDLHLQKVQEEVESTGIKLNKEKCKFRQEELIFLVDATGVRLGPAKVQPIWELSTLENIHKLKRILGIMK